MKLLYKFSTRIGPFYIGQSPDGRFHPIYDNESLGSYAHPWQAAAESIESIGVYGSDCNSFTGSTGQTAILLKIGAT